MTDRNSGAPDFFQLVEQLVRTSQVISDRPRGCAHPRIPEAIYPLDYGYLDGTVSGDGKGVDVFVGSATEREVAGILVIADPVKRDAESRCWSTAPPTRSKPRTGSSMTSSGSAVYWVRRD